MILTCLCVIQFVFPESQFKSINKLSFLTNTVEELCFHRMCWFKASLTKHLSPCCTRRSFPVFLFSKAACYFQHRQQFIFPGELTVKHVQHNMLHCPSIISLSDFRFSISLFCSVFASRVVTVWENIACWNLTVLWHHLVVVVGNCMSSDVLYVVGNDMREISLV